MVLVVRLEPWRPFPEDDEPVLEEHQASPVGYRVSQLPDFVVDPNDWKRGMPCCLSVRVKLVLGSLVVVAVGAFVVFLGLSNLLDDTLLDGQTTLNSVTDVF